MAIQPPASLRTSNNLFPYPGNESGSSSRNGAEYGFFILSIHCLIELESSLLPKLILLYFLNLLKEQKEALEKGLVTMEDVEMAVAEAKGDLH